MMRSGGGSIARPIFYAWDGSTAMAGEQEAGVFDYVIVGSGAAGSVVTNRLSEDPGVTVCVLEAGPPDYHPYIHIPAGFIKMLFNPGFTWQFKTEPGEYTGGRAIPTTQGRTLGGTSSINGMIYNRGQRADFDNWAQRGNRGWGYADVLPYFKRSERRIGLPTSASTGATAICSSPTSIGSTRCARPLSRARPSSASRATPTTTACR